MKMMNKRRMSKCKQRLESEWMFTHKVEKKKEILEKKLKTFGYYEGKQVMLICGEDGIDVDRLSIDTKTEFIKPVHCRCTSGC